DREVDLELVHLRYDAIACGLDNWTKHVLHPGVVSWKPADRLERHPLRCRQERREEPVWIDQLGGFAGNQGDCGHFARMFRRNEVVGDRGQVDYLRKGIADL